jgi:S-adenosylmethionine hydrolase
VDPVTLLPGLLPVTREEHGAVVAEVLWIDRFGNAQLNVDPDEVSSLGDRVRLRFAETKRTAIRADNYAALRTGEVGLVVDSYGLLSIAVDRGSAAEQLGLHAGDPVTLESFEGPMLPLRAVSEPEADT